jgi:hemolysin III
MPDVQPSGTFRSIALAITAACAQAESMFSWARGLTRHITADELANTLTHGFGLISSIVGFIILLILAILRGGKWQIVGCAIFGVTLVCLYAASTFYHGISSPRAKRALMIFDHSAIYLLIAGTYTPFLLVNLRGSCGWSLLAVIWSMAVVGILFKLWFADRFPAISVSAYVGMGWLGVIAAHQVYTHVPLTGVVWIVLGGLAYTIGVIFYACRRIPHHHVIWHLLVMAGSACHYIAVLYSVFPRA